jgi:plastocyanin
MHRFLQGLAIAGIAILTIACSSGGGATPAPASVAPSSPGASAPASGGAVVVAKDLAFQPTSLTIAADTPTDIVLDNQENVPHNIAIKDATGASVFKGEIVTSAQVANAVPALAAGQYTFWCEVHPNMTGTLTAG